MAAPAYYSFKYNFKAATRKKSLNLSLNRKAKIDLEMLPPLPLAAREATKLQQVETAYSYPLDIRCGHVINIRYGHMTCINP